MIFGCMSRHRWTGRYEAHLWDKSTWNQNQNKKGKQGVSLPLIDSLLLFLHDDIKSNLELKCLVELHVSKFLHLCGHCVLIGS